MAIKEKIDGLANMAASKYVESGVCMNKTIADAARAEKLGKEHIARIVEAANKKVFIKLFPDKHEFDVASKEGVEKMINNEIPVKAASSSYGKAQYGDVVNFKLLELTKPVTATIEKTASVRSLMILRSQIKRAAEELEYEARQKRAEVLRAENDLIAMSKQTMLRGASFGDLETYALSMAGGNAKVAEVIDGIYDKVKHIRFIEKKALSRGKPITPFVGRPNSYTQAIDKMIKIACEDLPIIENSIELLNEKLAQINSITKNDV